MVDWSLFIQGTVDVLWVNGFFQGIHRDFVFIDKRDITVDALGSTVEYCMSINFSPMAYNLNFNLNGQGAYILNCIYWYMGSLENLEISEIVRITMGWWYNSH